MNNLLLILAMMVLSNGNISLFDNKNKSNKSAQESTTVEVVEPSSKSMQNKRSSPRVKKIKKIKKKSKSREKKSNSDTVKNILKFDMGDVNKGINLMDLSEEDLDRGMEIITRTKKYMNKEERNILIKLESVLDLVKGIKKLNDINILSEEDESEFFRSMDEEDKKNMMIKEIIEVFPENKKQSVEKALEMKKMIDLFAELFLPDGEDGGGFSLSSLADINNLGSISNLKLLGSLLRSLDDEDDYTDEDYSENEYEYIEVDEDDVNEIDEVDEEEDEYIDVKRDVNMNKKHSNNRNKRKRNKRRVERKT